ncbi:hypothetical protein [Streptomonospora salina]|uniref:Uncharacterized protein n=1 Tax=Streptomonospora salina TaxID=104205 RepID=A0A841E1P0_9ACTN|nr:hypothetical protein [Streptomonospora salina]MBB5996612.1 hypothetical protein [Streptomonospora salina]
MLHTLGLSMALAHQGAARGMAEHWASLTYLQALTQNEYGYLGLSSEGRETVGQHRAVQARELGNGIGLALAGIVLRRRYPDHRVSLVPADTTLLAGWSTLSPRHDAQPWRFRPEFFAEIWRPGDSSLIVPIVGRANHASGSKASYQQLAAASAHVEAVHIGEWNETPGMVFSSALLPRNGPLTVHALHAEGAGGWLGIPAPSDLDQRFREGNGPWVIRPPQEGGTEPPTVPGYHLRPEDFPWFRRVSARTAAAGLAAFVGSPATVTRYITNRQGRKRFGGHVHAVLGSNRGIRRVIRGIGVVGTDHVFRLNGTRVEAFSGVAEPLFGHLERGEVERYRREVYALRGSWPGTGLDRGTWNGPVSVHEDGSVLAIRRLPIDGS